MADVRVVAGMQLSNGSWRLSTLAVGMGRSKVDLETKCPTPINGSAVMATAWATVLAITVLQQMSGFELAVRNAKQWLKLCSLPEGASLDQMYTSAKEVV